MMDEFKKYLTALCDCGARWRLTLAENGKDIVVNNYTRLRLEKQSVEKKYNLPIVLSGVKPLYAGMVKNNVD